MRVSMTHLPETSVGRHHIVKELDMKSGIEILAAIVKSESLEAIHYRPVLEDLRKTVPKKHIDQFARVCRMRIEILRELGAPEESARELRQIVRDLDWLVRLPRA